MKLTDYSVVDMMHYSKSVSKRKVIGDRFCCWRLSYMDVIKFFSSL